MIKLYEVTAQLFWDATHIVKYTVKAHTSQKAEIMAINKIKKNNPNVRDMIKIIDIKEV